MDPDDPEPHPDSGKNSGYGSGWNETLLFNNDQHTYTKSRESPPLVAVIKLTGYSNIEQHHFNYVSEGGRRGQQREGGGGDALTENI